MENVVLSGEFVPSRMWYGLFNFHIHSVVTFSSQDSLHGIDYLPLSKLQVYSPTGSFRKISTRFHKNITF
jgi:hypothetical protein